MKNGAQLLCDSLLSHDIDVCFANPGTSEMHFVAALDERPELRCVLGLFEGVVTGAADGYARMTGKAAATLLHLGPGLANGLANLHNAKRAHSPMVNIVGDHAQHHLLFDAPLHSDIESLARPMSDWVQRIDAPEHIPTDVAEAVRQSQLNQGQISTLILPANVAWSTVNPHTPTQPATTTVVVPTVDTERVKEAAVLLRSSQRITVLLGGNALVGEALTLAGQIAQATHLQLYAETSNKRITRGAGHTPLTRFPYDIDAATLALQNTDVLLLIGAKNPVAFFAYPNKPSVFLPPTARCVELVAKEHDTLAFLRALAAELDISEHAPIYSATPTRAAPPAPGVLTSHAIAHMVADALPANAIVCDESISHGHQFFLHSQHAAPHDYLQLTGGAIGIGLPLATGAAIACPDRTVITLQADGSAMYTVQALWTQARENLRCITIIFSNRRYATLFGEMQRMGIEQPGRNASDMFELDRPAIDWVSLAKGMGVPATRVDNQTRFRQALRQGLQEAGPWLIEAVLD